MKKILALLIVLAGLGGGAALGIALRPAPPPEPAEEGAEQSSEGVDEGADGKTAGAPAEGGKEGGTEPAGKGEAEEGHGGADAAGEAEAGAGERAYIDIGRQMIIPVVEGGETRALMLFELAVDVPAAETERVYQLEPRLRDAFLRVLFEMSHTGAFLDTYTDARVVEELRGKLLRAARRHLGPAVADVLILDIVRQEL